MEMNGLWKKESNKNGSCYIDLFEWNDLPTDSRAIECLHQIFRSKSKKNDEFAAELRRRGNQQFEQKNWRSAMELYNFSLCYATDASDNISLAYANRSSCYLQLKMYEQCLIDIELAIEAKYPKDLMRKLNNRKATCLEEMQKSTQDSRLTADPPILSYSADARFPCLANVLELRYNSEFGAHLGAKSDIKIGETIILEEMFTFGARFNDRSFCRTCFKFQGNFIPCRNCLGAFCDARCLESNEIHKIDCGAKYYYTPPIGEPGRVPPAADISIMKSILVGVNAFSSVDDLIKFVEGALVSRDFDSLHGLSDVQLKYGQFLKLLPMPKALGKEIMVQYLMCYKNLFEIGEIQQRFNSMRLQRFLMHLVWHHILIIRSNAYTFRPTPSADVNTLGNFTALLNHSRSPNVCVTFSGNQQMATTIRPVKKGDQLFTEHQNVDMENFPFARKCSKCVPDKIKETD